MAVLEHVKNPISGFNEIQRVLRPGGKAFLYVPFLFRQHAHDNEYSDYFRFTRPCLEYYFKDCSVLKIQHTAGILELFLKLTPFHRFTYLTYLARWLDGTIPQLKKARHQQTAGFYVYMVK
jgi:ubiquinone/menaquinone biosynthesis C-methylase UbiE